MEISSLLQPKQKRQYFILCGLIFNHKNLQTNGYQAISKNASE